jgi:hypothetical protein
MPGRHECNALARRPMKMLVLIHCRGLLYQALPPGSSPVGFDKSNPYFALHPFAFFVAILTAGKSYRNDTVCKLPILSVQIIVSEKITKK